MARKIKRYERDGKILTEEPKGVVMLAGTNLYLDESEVLYEKSEFTEADLHEAFDIKSGEWYVEDGWVVGKNPQMNPGMIVSKDDYFGDILLELKAKMVAPSTHDINVMINGEFTDKRGMAYVTGLEAFWHGCIGFEKSPEYKLVVGTGMLDFDPNEEYLLQFGNAGGVLFTLVNGRLGLMVQDPDPIDTSKYGKIGFEAFSSWWKFKDVKVKKLKYERLGENYNPEF
ncbi:MAG: hypothetical protein IKJ68_00025 [Clostridia bacterium]|nr:hypothetical protein [Clostridia bacterium]